MTNQNQNLQDDANQLIGLSSGDLKGFSWMNPPTEVEFTEIGMRVKANPNTDFFNDPSNGKVTATAPLLYQELSGNFVATALVKPDFSNTWNAATLMVHMDSLNWIKFAFENSDATGKSIVSVVTRGVSDDANGVILADQDQIWLRIIRKGNLYALHWSKDGIHYKMARLSAMPERDAVKIGVEVQCPLDKPGKHEILFFSLEQKTIEDLRKGQ